MRLLLDTHALLWFCAGDESLSAKARAALEDDSNERFVSHASAWEVAIKLGLGKLTLDVPYAEIFNDVMSANGFVFLAPSIRHYLALLELPLHHRDPFDRLLIAQAKTEDLILVSNDAHLMAYDVTLHW